MRHVTLALMTAALLGVGAGAHAQYGYPPGYGGYGWQGWGATTAAGSTAAGMGAFAAGAGERNVENAQARSLNAQTAMGINDYIYACNTRNAQNNYTRMAQETAKNVAARSEIQDRILNHPTEEDVASGAALNAVMLEITNPQIYGRTLGLAQKPMPSAMVKRIPFEKASAGLTESIQELTNRDNIPTVYDRPEFAAGRKAARAVAEEMKAEATGQSPPKSATIAQFRKALDGIHATLVKLTDIDAGQRSQADKYLKGLYGLTKLIDSPSYDVYLAAVDQKSSVPLADVLTFMHAFNLQFGRAKTPEAREIYSQIYSSLAELRSAVNPPPGASQAYAAAPPKFDGPAADFFSAMPYNHLQTPPAAAPAAAAPATNRP